MEEQTIQYKAELNGRVELLDLTNSLTCFGLQFKRHVQRNPGIPFPSDVRLYIKEVRNGSVIAELVAQTCSAVLPFIDNANVLMEYAKSLKAWFDHFKEGTQPPEDNKLERQDLENMSGIIDMVAKNNVANLSITVNGGQVKILVNQNDANAMQNRMRKEAEAIKAIKTGRHYNKMLFIHQARNDSASRSGDKGIIESIYSLPVRLLFADKELKDRVVKNIRSPFAIGYTVDVDVETRNDQPVTYNVLAIHDETDFEN